MRADLLKALYGAMLQALPADRVLEYWNAHPLPIGGGLAGERLFARIWDEEKRVPPLYYWEIFNSVEEMLVGNGIRFEEFLPAFLRGSGRTSPVGLKFFLSCLAPLVSHFMGKRDPGGLIVELLSIGFRFTSPGAVFRSVSSKTGAHARYFYLYYRPSAASLPGYRGSELNCGVAQSMIHTPGLLGLPPFDEVTPICDGRDPLDLLVGTDARLEGGHLTIGGERYGASIRMERFFKEEGVTRFPEMAGDAEAILVERDYYCPRRERTVLRAGTVWRAPYYMLRAAYPRRRNSPAGLLRQICDRVSAGKLDPWKDVEPLHLALMERARLDYAIVYHSKDESISINGEHFIKGVPARIFRKILLLSRGARRFDFEYRMFKRDPEVCPNPKDSHFEIRLSRLAQRLSERHPCFVIRRETPGAFTFAHEARLSFRDQG